MLVTEHNLDFLSKPADIQLDPDMTWNDFIVGTCHGRWAVDKDNYYLLAIINEVPGNGHLTDVLQWFESSCKRDKRNLVILEFFNPAFKKHCIDKRGFKAYRENDVIKTKFK